MKKILLCVMLVCCGFANPIAKGAIEIVEQGGKLFKKQGGKLVKLGGKSFKNLNAVEKKILKNSRISEVAGVMVAKRNHIFRPTQENLERMRQGRAPIGTDGKPIELHHLKQDKDGVLVEMSHTEHRVKYYNDLHKCKPGMQCTTEVEHGNEWNALRQKFWRDRAKEFDKAS